VLTSVTVEDLSLLVANTLELSGLEKFSILGHSLGAMIALELSLQRPELLEKMVIYGGCPDGYLPGRFETTDDSIDKIMSNGIEVVAANIATEWFQLGKLDPMYSLALEAGKRSNEAAAIDHLRTWDNWKASSRLMNVQTPTLIICGDNDRSIPGPKMIALKFFSMAGWRALLVPLMPALLRSIALMPMMDLVVQRDTPDVVCFLRRWLLAKSCMTLPEGSFLRR
jgi:pimeloyl-ACP methyl ester carboxylesterase